MDDSSVVQEPRRSRLTDHLSIGVLTRAVPRFVVDEVLAETGRKEKRSRLLPAHVVVYFVMALALFRDGYDEVMRTLVHGLRFARTRSRAWHVPSTGALSQARNRLGEAPLKQVFARVARPLATAGTPGAWLGRWRLMAIDGVMLDLPETAANLAAYPKAVGGTRRPYPQVKIVGLGECGTHALIGASFGSIRQGERELATPLAARLEANMLVLADRGFFSYELWRTLPAQRGPTAVAADQDHPAARAHRPARRVLPVGDQQLQGTGQDPHPPRPRRRPPPRHAHPGPRHRVPDRHRRPDHPLEVFRLITTILDPAEVDAHELAAAYAQRWEFESSLREIECQLLEPGSTLRSKTPEMVRQEIWGLFLTHYAIRSFMTEAADTVDLDPDRLSTIRAINIIRRSVTDPAGFSPRNSRTATPPGGQ